MGIHDKTILPLQLNPKKKKHPQMHFTGVENIAVPGVCFWF